MISTDRRSSSRRTSWMFPRTSGLSMAGLRMSPSSPPVAHTNTVCTPSAWYLATVPAPLDASSSGWAWTQSRQRRSSIPQNYRYGATTRSMSLGVGEQVDGPGRLLLQRREGVGREPTGLDQLGRHRADAAQIGGPHGSGA